MSRRQLSFTSVREARIQVRHSDFCIRCDKYRFRSEEYARNHIGLLIRRPRTQPGTFALHPYQCPVSHGWHVGRDRRTLCLDFKAGRITPPVTFSPSTAIPPEDCLDTLFELRNEDTIREEAIALNRLRIHDVVAGRGPWQLSTRQRRLIEILRFHQGRIQAISSADLEQRLQTDDRAIRAEVRELVVSFKLPIVATLDAEKSGYFFATTAQERIDGARLYIQQATKLLRRAQIILNERDMGVIFGQVNLQLAEAD